MAKKVECGCEMVRVPAAEMVRLLRIEAQFEFVKRLVERKDNYANIEDLKILLDLKKGIENE